MGMKAGLVPGLAEVRFARHTRDCHPGRRAARSAKRADPGSKYPCDAYFLRPGYLDPGSRGGACPGRDPGRSAGMTAECLEISANNYTGRSDESARRPLQAPALTPP